MRTLSVSATSFGREPVRLSDLLDRGPVLLDGAMGTELDARGVDAGTVGEYMTGARGGEEAA